MGLEFEWDASKTRLNSVKHGVRFDDPDRSATEDLSQGRGLS
jgi:uncharacterized DUF497 family protein